MGMCCRLFALRDASIARVLAQPALVWRIAAPDDPDIWPQLTDPPRGLLARWFRRREPSAAFALGTEEGEVIDIDKAWHGIHYLLTHTAWEGTPPWSFLVHGTQVPADADGTTFHVHDATATRRACAALASVPDAELRARFDPQAMARLDIYPSIWTRDPADDDTPGYLLENVARLRGFLDRAAARGLGCLIEIG
jgi:hypothetical protein